MKTIIVRRRGIGGGGICKRIALAIGPDAISCIQGRRLYRKYINKCFVIPWGVAEEMAMVNTAIYRVTNKRIARAIMHKEGIPVPTPVPLRDVAGVNEGRVVVRPERHRACMEYYQLPPKTVDDLPGWFREGRAYAAMYYPHDTELRFHVAHGKILYAQNKRESWYVIQRKVLAGKTKYIQAMRSALRAVDALGLNFGAVDVLFNEQTGEHVVGEVNTAPGIRGDGYGSRKYAAYFTWLVKNNNPQHWEHEKFQKGSSLIWKNEQLEGVV